MIVPKKMVIGNFLSIAKAELTLADQGLVLIEGVNEDDPSAVSNGSGKSSIVDALSWCLYGITARGVTGDSVVNLKAGKNCFVEVELEIDGDIYTVMRGRKHGSLKNRVRLQRGVHDLTLGTDKQTQDRINNLLGCSPEVFNASIYMGQENMPDLPAMGDKGLKSVLEEALSLHRLDQALEVANDRLLDATSKVSSLATKIEGLKKKVFDNVHEITRLEGVIVDLKVDLDNLKIFQDERRISYDIDRKDFLKRLADRQADLAKALGAKRINVGALRTRRTEDEVEPIKKALDAVERKIIELNGERRAIMRTINSLEDDSGCTACGRAYETHDHTDKILELRGTVATLDAKIDQHNEAAVDLEVKIKAARTDIVRECDAASLANGRMVDPEDIKEDIAAIQYRLKQLDSRYEDSVLASERNTKTKEERLKETNDKIGDLRHENKRIDGYIDDFEGNLLAALRLQDTLTRVKMAMGRKGFRGEVLDQVTPYLNARTAKYMQALTGGNIEAVWGTILQNSGGDYVEHFHINVTHVSGVDNFKGLSGGEKRKVRLATALALQDLIATRAVKPIKIFIADEIDDAIDEAGLELLMGVLEAKALEMGSVFIISHNDIGDWVRNKITVTKHDGVSTFKAP